MDDVPFDLKDLRCIVYDKAHPKWGDSLTRNVSRTMRSVLEEPDDNEPLFSEIENEVAYPSIEALEVSERTREPDEEILDVAGRWSLTEEWTALEDHKTNQL